MAFENDLISGFKPRFKSIDRDCDRYSDILFAHHENDEIDAKQFLELNAKGSLWIIFEYIDRGLLDMVEQDLRQSIINRDSHGELHPQVLTIFERLLEISENERVISIYGAAIQHRLTYLLSNSTPTHWIGFYYRQLEPMISDFGALLDRLDADKNTLICFQQQLAKIEKTAD